MLGEFKVIDLARELARSRCSRYLAHQITLFLRSKAGPSPCPRVATSQRGKKKHLLLRFFSTPSPTSAGLSLLLRSLPPRPCSVWDKELGTEGRLAGSLFMDVWAQSLRKVISRSAAQTPVPTLSLWLIRLFKRTNQQPGEDVNYPSVIQIEYSHGPAALVSTYVPVHMHKGWHKSAHTWTLVNKSTYERGARAEQRGKNRLSILFRHLCITAVWIHL